MRFTHRFRSLGLMVSVLLAASAPASADEILEGQTEGGAYYKITVPTAWNGKLVLWNHGFDLGEVGAVTDMGPLVDVQLSEGYAVAASSYRQAGWAVFKTVADLRALVRVFADSFGEPSEIIVYGGSLGGLVTVQAIEKGIGGNVTGAGALCGAVAGSRNWDAALDIRLIYDAVCGAVPGAAIAGGAAGSPAGSTLTAEEVSDRLNICTGIQVGKSERSRKQKQRLKKILGELKIPEEFLDTDVWYSVFALGDLVHDRGKLKGKSAIGNAAAKYTDAAIDAAIARVQPKNGPARRLRKNYTPTGINGDIKVLGMHTDQDGLVVVENLGEYARQVAANGNPDNLVVAVVREETPSHCGFTQAEGLAGWESLTAWIGGVARPTVADLQNSCDTFVGLGLAAGPCRFDPDYTIGRLDDRIPPR